MLLSILLITLLACSDNVTTDGTITTVDGSISYEIDQYSGTFTFADIAPFDTINNEIAQPIMIYTSVDTMIFQPDTNPHYINIQSGDSTKIIAVTYFSQSRRNKAKYLKLLRDYPEFSPERPSVKFNFTYSSTNDRDLIELRNKYNLDSIAGDGDEISQIINLLNWTNKIVRHDGDNDPADPHPKNALNIIATANLEQKGVNCRMMATILNEAYLAAGFKSRHITCLPYDKEDPDCHVINMVYSDSLNKWLYVDPTFAGYFTDSAGTMLSISEVRDKLINGEKLILPDNLNWNGEPKNHDSYKTYMTKNLFRFSCPISSEFGYESKNDRAWVDLLPVGYDTLKVNTVDTTKTDTKTSLEYYIANSDAFWALP